MSPSFRDSAASKNLEVTRKLVYKVQFAGKKKYILLTLCLILLSTERNKGTIRKEEIAFMALPKCK